MTRTALVGLIKKRSSYLCIGLDTDPKKIPSHLLAEPDPVLAFNRAVIDATRENCVSYKINTAFYEAQGAAGWATMQQTVAYIGDDHFCIADAKRGDIGNTADQYAKAFFETMPFDAVTVAPYMGEDSVRPFLGHAGKWAIVLGLTSNPGAADFELLRVQEAGETGSGERLYERVLRKTATWGDPGNLMFVTGATRPEEFTQIRKLVPDHFLLVPGVGAQGGSLEAISRQGMNGDVGLLVNVSRAICFASGGRDFAAAAAEKAKAYRDEMETYLAG